jgi:hypothetical protein
MASNLQEAIEHGKYVLANIQNAAMATVNEDGSPHNTPYFFMHDGKLQRLYWISNPASLHSLNIERSGQLFVVLYDSNGGGGVYIAAEHGRVLYDEELRQALQILNEMRVKAGKDLVKYEDYNGDNHLRIYGANVQHVYVNYGERNTEGKLVRDIRCEIKAGDVLHD